MKRVLKLIYLTIIMVLLFKCNTVFAEIKELTCIYKGGVGHEAKMLIQDKTGNYHIRTNSKNKTPGFNDEDWSSDISEKVEFGEGIDTPLTSCPKYVEYPISKVLFVNEKGWRRDYELLHSYEYVPSASDSKESYAKGELEGFNYEEGKIDVCEYEVIDIYIYDGYLKPKIKSNLYDTVELHFSYSEFMAEYQDSNGCPTKVYHEFSFTANPYSSAGTAIFYLDKENKSMQRDPLKNPKPGQVIDVEIPEIDSCESLFGSPTDNTKPAYYFVVVFKVIRYVAIIILVAMSVMDFITAASSQNEDALNKAAKKTITRFIFCVIIFLLPDVIRYVLSFINEQAMDLCGIE